MSDVEIKGSNKYGFSTENENIPNIKVDNVDIEKSSEIEKEPLIAPGITTGMNGPPPDGTTRVNASVSKPEEEDEIDANHDITTNLKLEIGESKSIDEAVLTIRNGNFSWDLEGKTSILTNINIQIPAG